MATGGPDEEPAPDGDDPAVDGADLLEVVASREPFLAAVLDSPAYKRDLIDSLDTSRSTVDRALRELTDAGLVERTEEGFVATAPGALALDRYRESVTDMDAIIGASDALDPLSASGHPPASVVAGATVRMADGPRRYEALDPITDAVERADRVRAVLPNIADSDHLRLYRARAVDGGADVELVCAQDLYEALVDRFPGQLRELVLEGETSIHVGDVPAFGTVLTERNGRSSVSVVVYADPGSVHAVLHTESVTAVNWAGRLFETARADASEVSADVATLPSPDAASTAEAARPVAGHTVAGTDDAGRNDRTAQPTVGGGFIRLSPAFFQRRSPAPPEQCWRTGLGLPEVAAGYAVDRKRPTDEEPESVTECLVDRLTMARDQVVLGPPGSGKSTVCKSVACCWYERGHGPVFYRESGRGTAFDDPDALRRAVSAADGHSLVVVEDAVRAEANDVFETVSGLRGTDDVTFLFDARTGEWKQAESFPPDAELDAVRAAVEPFHLPRVDEHECERFLQRFERTIDESVPVTPEALLEEVRSGADERSGPDLDGSIGSERARPGETVLLFHRLASYASPLAETETKTTTTLDEDVQRLYRDLRSDDSDLSLDVAILVNLLNAAGLGVPPEYIHALADEGEHRIVNETLDRLEGQVLFPTADAAEYRAIHEAWSKRFLEHLLADTSPAAAHRRVGKGLSAVLSLVEADRRRQVQWVLEGDADALAGPEQRPRAWIEQFVEQVFELGLESPKLAPLYGKTGYEAFEIPEAAPDSLDRQCIEWRGRMYLSGNRLDRANHEFEELATAAETLEGPDRDHLLATSLTHRGRVALNRSEWSTAVDRLGRALARYQRLDDERGIDDCLFYLGKTARQRGDFSDAEAYFRRALRGYQSLRSVEFAGRCLQGLGSSYNERGENERAEIYLEAALRRFRQTGTRKSQAECYQTIGLCRKEQEDFDGAVSRYKRALEIFREVGDRFGEAAALGNLGEVSRLRSEYERAEAYQREALNVYQDLGDKRSIAAALNNLGIIAECRGDYDAAEELHLDSLAIKEELDHEYDKAITLHNLGVISKDREEYETARERLEDSLSTLERVGDHRAVAITRIELGEVAEGMDSSGRAKTQYQQALETARSNDLAHTSLNALDHLVDFHETREDRAAAAEQCRMAIELAEEAGLDDRQQEFEQRMAAFDEHPAE